MGKPYKPACLGGCGKPVETRSGYCRKCRGLICPICKKPHTPSAMVTYKKICWRCNKNKEESIKKYSLTEGVS